MTDEERKDNKKPTPPYLPFKTFKRLIGIFKENMVPQRIDPSVLSRFSGSDIAAIIPALKFFDLIDENQMAQPPLYDLVEAYETSEWKAKFKKIKDKAYDDIINGLDLSTATRKQLDEKFQNISAPTLSSKCVRFYLAAAIECGTNLSKFIIARQKRSGIKAVRIPKAKVNKIINKEGEENRPDDIPVNPQSLGYKEFPVPIKGKQPVKIWIPEDITENEWDNVKFMMELTTELIRAYFGFAPPEGQE